MEVNEEEKDLVYKRQIVTYRPSKKNLDYLRSIKKETNISINSLINNIILEHIENENHRLC